MDGQKGQDGDAWDKGASRRIASLNGTGKHPSTSPQRPAGTPRLDTSPTPRITRPKQEAASPRKARRNLLLLGCVFLICALFACVLGYAAFSYLNGLNATSGASTTASDFITSLAGPKPNYDQAYKDLGPGITLQASSQDFAKQAQGDDLCYGSITDFKEIAGSAKVQGDSQMYSYNVTRSKLQKPYQLTLTLQPDPENANAWKVTKYEDNLPVSTTCK